MKTDNNPDIILTLVAQCHRAHEVWADPHNESFYIRPLSQTNDRRLPEDDVKPDHVVREITPSSDDPHLIKATEPALRISFSKKPKNPELGYLLGSDHETCDIFLGSLADCISHQMYAISFNQYNEVTMKSSSGNRTLVTYREQQGTRNNFTVSHLF